MTVTPWPETETRARRALKNEDYQRFLPLIRRTAMRFARKVPSHITVGDLLAYGWLGLVEAYSRADESMPPEEFEAYALYRVRGAMLDYLRSLDPATREMRGVSRRVTRAIKDLTTRLRRAPEEAEIAECLGLSEDAYHDTLAKLQSAGMSRLELLDIDQCELESTANAPDEDAAHKEICAAVAEAVAGLPPRLQLVVALYYQEDCTIREIGAVLGLSESRASQLHTEAVHRLRAAIGKE